MLATDRIMLHLYHRSGLQVETRTGGGVCRLTMPIETPEPAAAVDGRAERGPQLVQQPARVGDQAHAAEAH